MAPRHGVATIEKAAINAVMAGCAPEAFPLVIAALEAIVEPEFNLFGVSTTTSSVFPMVMVNGPTAWSSAIDMSGGCMGGAGGRGSMTIGRTISLCMRNIGGQKVNETSKSVFGQPARVGMCFAEWEEQSPWPSLAERRGFDRADEVVTVHAGKGTTRWPMSTMTTPGTCCGSSPRAWPTRSATSSSSRPRRTAKSCWPSIPCGRPASAGSSPWSRILQTFLLENAWQPIELWPEPNQRILEEKGRVDGNGRVWINERPEQFVIIVCGGLGNLHAICLPAGGRARSRARRRCASLPPVSDQTGRSPSIVTRCMTRRSV